MGNLDDLRLVGAIKDKVYIGPQRVTIFLNNKCNLKCTYCFNRYSISKHLKKIPLIGRGIKKKKPDEFSYRMFKNLLRDLVHLKVEKIVFSSRGEPILHSKFKEIISDTKEAGLKIGLLTNGVLLSEKVTSLFGRGDSFTINLSSFKKSQYKRIQGGSGESLKHIIKNITSIRSTGENKPWVNLVMLVHYRNFKDIESYLKSANAAGAGSVIFKWMQSPGDHFSWLSILDNNDLDIFSYPVRVSEVKKEIEGIIKRNPGRIMANNLKELYNLAFLQKDTPSSCFVGWYHPYIYLNGDVKACCISRDNIGNLNEKSFKEIWNSPQSMRARKSLKYDLHSRKRILELCRRSCVFERNLDIAEKVNKHSRAG